MALAPAALRGGLIRRWRGVGLAVAHGNPTTRLARLADGAEHHHAAVELVEVFAGGKAIPITRQHRLFAEAHSPAHRDDTVSGGDENYRRRDACPGPRIEVTPLPDWCPTG